MTDRTAASAGVALAGVALAATLRGWPAFATALALAAVALAAFALRRYGRLARPVGAVVAGFASLGAAVAGAYGFATGGLPPGAAVTAVAGVGGAAAALADWLELDRAALVERLRVAGLGAVIGAGGILLLYAWTIAIAILLRLVVPGEISTLTSTALSTVALGGGTLTAAALYIRWSDRDVSFLDVRWPTARHVGLAALATVGAIGANLAIGLLFLEFQVESAPHSVVEAARTQGEPEMLLVLIPLSYLVIAPGEEILYRNVIQKVLRETYSPVAGVALASAIFAAVHLPAYSSPGATLLATLNTLGIIFALALILGTVYELTRNVVVSMLVHGSFNAIAFWATYSGLTGMAG